MRRFLSIFIAFIASCIFASTPMLQGELNVVSDVEWDPGVSYQVSGQFYDYSIVGYTAYSITNGDYIFTEDTLGNVDAFVVTNVEYADAVNVTCDVVYAESGTSAAGMVVGYAGLCSISTNGVGYPQQPSPEFCHLSENLLNQIRNYSLRRIQAGGGSGTNTTDSAAIHTNQIGSGLLWNGSVLTATNSGSTNTGTIVGGTIAGGAAFGTITNAGVLAFTVNTNGMVGPQGTQGIQGIQGPPGTNGIDGINTTNQDWNAITNKPIMLTSLSISNTTWNPVSSLTLLGSNGISVSYLSLIGNSLSLVIDGSEIRESLWNANSNAVLAHLTNTAIHVSASDRTNWDGKATLADVAGVGYATGTPLYVETYLGTLTGLTVVTGATAAVTTNAGIIGLTVPSGGGGIGTTNASLINAQFAPSNTTPSDVSVKGALVGIDAEFGEAILWPTGTTSSLYYPANDPSNFQGQINGKLSTSDPSVTNARAWNSPDYNSLSNKPAIPTTNGFLTTSGSGAALTDVWHPGDPVTNAVDAMARANTNYLNSASSLNYGNVTNPPSIPSTNNLLATNGNGSALSGITASQVGSLSTNGNGSALTGITAAQVGAVGTNQTFMPGVLNGTNGLVYYNPNNLTNYWILTP